MASNSAFAIKGATPGVIQKPVNIQQGMPGLTFSQPQQPSLSGLTQSKPVSLGNQPGLIQTPKPTTPLKKTTTNNVDGSSTTHEYHAEPQPKTLNQTPAETKGPVLPTTLPPQPTTQSQTPPTPYTPPNQGIGGVSQGGLIGNLVQKSQTSSPEYQQAVEAYKQKAEQLRQLDQEVANQTREINQSRTWTSRAQGEQAQANIVNSANRQALANELASLGNIIGQANTQQGLQQSALGTAIGANAPLQVPYSAQVLNPVTGQPVGGGTTSGGLQDAVSNVVQKVISGQMTYNDALQALSGYGQGGVNALQQALPSNFNVAQSNTLAGQQGSIGVNYQLADTALTNVENLMKELNVSQKTNIPIVNKLTQGFSTVTGLGSEQTRAVTGAVQSLRNAYASLLASAKGGTPTDYSGQALAEIPDQPTPNDIKAIRHNFEVLGKARANILGNPGQASGTTSGSTTGGSIWDF